MTPTIAERVRNAQALLDRKFAGPHDDFDGMSGIGLLFVLVCARADDDGRLAIIEGFEQWIANNYEGEFPGVSVCTLYHAAVGEQQQEIPASVIQPVKFPA